MVYDCLLCVSNEHGTRDCPHREGTCDMCGRHYRSYMDHLAECPGGD